MPSLIQVRRGTSTQWNLANTILASGEIGVETDHSPVRVKIGDGVSAWAGLPYLDSSAIRVLNITYPLQFDSNSGTLSVDYQKIIDGANF